MSYYAYIKYVSPTTGLISLAPIKIFGENKFVDSG
jgi:hypothetical protein